MRLIDATSPNAQKTCILSIWNGGELHGSLRENTVIDLKCVTANGYRGKDVQLTANSFTLIQQVQSVALSSHAPYMRKLTSLAEVNAEHFQPYFNEFDTIGFVLKIDDIVPNYPFQSVFIVDALKNILCIKFWGNIQQYAYDDIVQVNKFLVISQLEWRPQNRHNRFSQAFVNEFTTFSESPKSTERSLQLASLRESINKLDFDEFIEACSGKLTESGHGNKENLSTNISSKSLDMSLNQALINRKASSSPATSGILQKVNLLRNYGSPPAFRNSYLNSKQTPNSSRKPFKNPSRAQQSTANKS